MTFIRLHCSSIKIRYNHLSKSAAAIHLQRNHYFSNMFSVPLSLSSSDTTTNNKVINFEWMKLEPKPDPKYGIPCTRSSHGVSLGHDNTTNNNTLFVYGGEHIARTPLVDHEVCWLCISNCTEWKCIDLKVEECPPPRVGHAQAIYNNRYVYIFGGRNGITMSESPRNDLWMFDIVNETWKEIVVPVDGIVPESRSFHKMICIGSFLYVFGGCGTKGRLNDLYEYSIINQTWKSLGNSTLLRGRGGPNLLSFKSGNAIGIICGFAGEETNDGQIYNLTKYHWDDQLISIKNHDNNNDELRKRSVCISSSFPSLGISIIFGGEVNPSDRGHEGAGGFENDIVLLNENNNGQYIQTITSSSQQQNSSTSGKWPLERGWSDSDSYDNNNGNGQLYVFGGLAGDDKDPKRLNDLWKLNITSSKP